MTFSTVSISLSSGFSFQVPDGGSPCLHAEYASFNLVIERLLISGYRGRAVGKRAWKGFNLVIERLLISGGNRAYRERMRERCFNLVIERLLISGVQIPRAETH